MDYDVLELKRNETEGEKGIIGNKDLLVPND